MKKVVFSLFSLFSLSRVIQLGVAYAKDDLGG
jgi:hypothetical protein